MKIHPRHFLVQDAQLKIEKIMLASPEFRRLTALEAGRMLIDLGQRYLTLALRAERHPDAPDKKADEE